MFSPSVSKLSLKTSFNTSSVASTVCSFQDSPLSDLRITISRSFPLRAAKWGTSMITGLEKNYNSSNRPIESVVANISSIFVISFMIWLHSVSYFVWYCISAIIEDKDCFHEPVSLFHKIFKITEIFVQYTLKTKSSILKISSFVRPYIIWNLVFFKCARNQWINDAFLLRHKSFVKNYFT